MVLLFLLFDCVLSNFLCELNCTVYNFIIIVIFILLFIYVFVFMYFSFFQKRKGQAGAAQRRRDAAFCNKTKHKQNVEIALSSLLCVCFGENRSC
jgi:formate hydrogenlyase subunit 3/multisubunit Na+/H+ antiporter MnhD subunit